MPKRQAPKPRLVEHVSNSEDEEIPEDEAFNSEDELKYGSFFAGKNRAADGDSDEHSSDSESVDDSDEEEGDGGQYMLDLLNQLDSTPSSSSKKDDGLAVHVPESEFAASVVRGTSLTLDSLMEGLQDTKGFRDMQKTLTKVAQGKSTSVPVSRVVSDRVQRKVHYEEQSEQVSKWMEAVQENRQAESLDFRPKERMDITKEDLVDKFVPTTDFEKELHAALQRAGQDDEEAMLKREEEMMQEDDLGSNKLTMEEYKQRRAQLAKMRALMFYHEQKRHHINKIKSKKYRRIRKKQRERQKEAEVAAQVDEDPDMIKELEEKEEIERMKERMTLAHKNTSKWAKRVLKRGKNVDIDTRRALSAQLKRGDDLRKKMNATRENDEDEDDENEDLVDTARKVLADAEDDHIPIQNEGLFKLSFMQRGIEAQRERAKEEARQLLRELEDNAREQEGDDAEEGDTPDNYGPPEKKIASAEQMKGILSEGKLVASSLEFGNSNSIAVSGGIDIDLSEAGDHPQTDEKGSQVKSATSEHTSTMEVTNGADDIDYFTEGVTRVTKTDSPKQTKSVRQSGASNGMEESNPWLAPGLESSNPVSNGSGMSSKRNNKEGRKKNKGMVDVNGAVALLDSFERNSPGERAAVAVESESTSSKPIASLTQEELVQRAFAGAPADAEEEFAKEKEDMADRDDPTRKPKEDSSKTVSGWGSWAGEGAPARKPPRKLPKRLQPPEKLLAKRKRQDDKKPNVIINEKRVKKTANQFQIAQIPYPYKSREEYERAMTGAVGKEWNVTSSVKNMTRPEILTRTGKIIQPISKRVKQRRPAAKF